MRLLLALMTTLLFGACSGLPTPPPPSPGSMDDVVAALVRRNIAVHRLVSGDAGCPSQDLHDNAVHLEVAVGAQSSLKHIYLFRWRRQADFDAAAAAFDECVAEFRDAAAGADVSQVSLSPWRAFGPWDPQLARLVEEAIRATGGTAPEPSPS